MRVKRSLTLLVVSVSVTAFTLLCGVLKAQTISQPVQPSSVASSAIVLQALSAMSPAGAIIQDITLEGTVEYKAGSVDVNGTVSLKATASGSTRIDITLPDGVLSETRTIDGSGLRGRRSDKHGKISSVGLHNLLVDADWFAPVLLAKNLIGRWDIDATYRENGDSTHSQRITVFPHNQSGNQRTDIELKRLSRMNVEIDTTTFLPSGLFYQAHNDLDASGKGFPVRIVYSDYQVMGGLMLPSHIQKYVNGVLHLDIRLSKALVNTSPEPSTFTLQ